MSINRDKPDLWKADVAASVDQFNRWFIEFAPETFRSTRLTTTERVEKALLVTKDFASITTEFLRQNPAILPTLRMATCPPLARDRLSGLAGVSKVNVSALESGKIPAKLPPAARDTALEKLVAILNQLLDKDIFPWLATGKTPTEEERYRASTIVADRLCGSLSDPIIRNAQEQRQLAIIERYLAAKGYKRHTHSKATPINCMEPGTFSFRQIVIGRKDESTVNIPIDVVIQPLAAKLPILPIMIEAKSAGDFTNVNKRRKEEAAKMIQLRAEHGIGVRYILFLCGYFDSGYLGYEAAEGIDWVWEHRLEDIDLLGL